MRVLRILAPIDPVWERGMSNNTAPVGRGGDGESRIHVEEEKVREGGQNLRKEEP
jgi:hypothetical protein